VAAYAVTGVDALVTSSLYFGQPADIGVKIIPA
jgi:nicotinate-nucleotide pyrophosphorylase